MANTPQPYPDREAVAAEIDARGGFLEALEGRMTPEVMPEGDGEMQTAWHDLSAAWQSLNLAAERVARLLPEEEA